MKPISLDGCVTLGDEEAWATLSPCDLYRYLLGRCWDEALPMLGIVMENPSRASHEVSDRTVDKCILIAKQEGFGGVLVRNIAAFRSTYPKDLLECHDPVGPLNCDVLRMPLTETTVSAWGRLAKPIAQRLHVPLWRAESRCTHVFQWTEKAPFIGRHPLFLKNSTRLMPIESRPA